MKNVFTKIRDDKRKQEMKDNINAVIQNGKEWIMQNKEVLIAITPVVIGGVVTVTKVIGKRANLHKEESVKNLYCYDRSLGHYWKLNRKLSNKEWVEIDRRKNNGERLADILSSLKVLK